ncbi:MULTISPECIES: bifunctional diguanylate cyclase/phosphodiesterase [unclassified Saccharopolyspora]|uniref:putative bifunctional diguanylate cyclase/phosphodiesterase n=1 Tax=unclassified Saccharopolyspora TaxID=2646250 RepID=UPI001CD6AEFF|nr:MULTISPECIES: EAL domain-containing protein [unclassified Saccharopolyspora]MCA1187232.1 EAL domain-containing protein [Saccharopolyspora sp. 6T]MCA1193687.1 EAL domain-containing protein [Saccharopolyspora sp. 6V]MCA1227458.1 EAL domain-containing protein [Saccharopolyspora sp. 6M]MCA1282071.1 EAL domain-containing protein [Saccharopolyspora sp. 7B]
MGDPLDPDAGAGAQPERGGWRATLVLRWAERLAACSPDLVEVSDVELKHALAELADELAEALQDPSRAAESGRIVGERLVELRATGPGSLQCTLELIRDTVVGESGVGAVGHLLELLTSIAAGYSAADRERAEVQQRTTAQLLLRADRERRASDARFREVFTSTPIGVAICDLKGRFTEVNPALADILRHREADLLEMSIHDLFHPEEAAYLNAAYAELAEGGPGQRLRERRRLLRADGEQAWTYLAVSLLRGAEGEPRHIVTMVEDISDLYLLQERIQYQALHDAMTGLANRQYFRTRLEAAQGNFPPDGMLTLYHLGLDGFELINDGLGYETGDKVIRAVAHRLEQLVENEEALVARFGGTEFAILISESPHTPAIPEFAALINEELSEPIYIGRHGIATSASIGVVRRRVAEADPANMMWAADVALRRAEIAGARQWALFDPDIAPDERTEAQLAAIMPGALELGEFQVCYRPVMALDTGALISVEAQLRWDPPDHGALGHRECLQLAERSGVTLSLRDWLLREAWGQVGLWHRSGYRTCFLVELSENQVRDPDLVALVRSVLEDGDLDPSWMHLAVPTRVVMEASEELLENLRLLRGLGARVLLHSFAGSAPELRALRRIPVDGVRLAEELVDLVHGCVDPDDPAVRAVRQLAPLMHDSGVKICTGEVADEQQERHWVDAGCDFAVGPRYGEPVTAWDAQALLRKFGAAQPPHEHDHESEGDVV